METSVFLRMEIIVLGYISIGLILAVIYNSFKEKKISSFFIGIIGFLLFGGFPAWGFYINLNKYLTKPEPTHETKVCVDGKLRVQYQDTTHFCHPSDKNSTFFTSYRSPDGEVSKTDTCIICHRSFLDHDTHKEHRYYETVSYMNESINYCYGPKSDNNVRLAKIGTKNEVGVNSVNWDNVRKIDVLVPKQHFAQLNSVFLLFMSELLFA